MADSARHALAGRWIRGLGAAYTAVLGAYLLASPFLAAVAPFRPAGRRDGPDGRHVAALVLPGQVVDLLRAEGAFTNPLILGLLYVAFVCLMTVIWLSALVIVHRYRDVMVDSSADVIFRWCLVFAAVLTFAAPILVQDFWLSVAWGRVVAAGLNPYYVPATLLSDLPLRGDPGLMTYGPVWAIIAGVTATLTGGSAIGTAVLQKVVIVGAWIGVLYSVRALTRNQPLAARCTALIVVGWAPLGLLQGVAEGHNDVLLVVTMLVWLLWFERKTPVRSALALALSVSIKYVTAPLLAVHLAGGLIRRGRDRRIWLGSVLVAVLAVLLAIAVFYRSPDFFSPARVMGTWRFFTPSAVLLDLAESRFGVSRALAPAIDVLMILVATVFAVRWVRVKSDDAFRAAALWTMCGVLIGAVGHVWPWFVLWVLGLAAIQPARRIAWFVVGMAAAAPFILVPWRINPEMESLFRFFVPGVLFYVSGFAGAIVGARANRYLR